MNHISVTPVRLHARRPETARHPDTDPRWDLLDLVRACKHRLGLRDRDISILRGLLSFVSPALQGNTTIFASNRTLSSRCDGVEERTLRRHLAKLERCGLVVRRLSPSGKRYRVQGDSGAEVLTYGIDISPLLASRPNLLTMAKDIRREDQLARVNRALIRHWLFQNANHTDIEMLNSARRCLRQKLGSAELEILLETLRAASQPKTSPCDHSHATTNLSGNNSQIDRHIHNREEESSDSEVKPGLDEADDTANDLTVSECIELAPTALSFCTTQPQTWREIVEFSEKLGCTMGVDKTVLGRARELMGPYGFALTVLGLIEGFERIKRPSAYLQSLCSRAAAGEFKPIRAFRSLVGKHFVPACIPG